MKSIAIFTAAVLAIGCAAEELTPRERRLLQLIESLEERVEKLEQQLDERPAPPPAAANATASTVESASAAPTAEPQPNDMRVYWDEGLQIETRDERFQFQIGGRLHTDWRWFDDSSNLDIVFGDVEDGVDFRRLRTTFSGTLVDDFDFKIEVDFAGGDATLTDAWLAYNGLSEYAEIKAGHFKEPFSFEQITSSNETLFMERSIVDALVPARNTGLQLSNSHFNDRMTWAAGVFRDTDGFGSGSGDGDYAVTARATGLPWYTQDGRGLLHLGAGASYRNADDSVRYRARSEASDTPSYIDTGDILNDDTLLLGAEAALRWDRFTLQGEYMRAELNNRFGPDSTFDGYYVFASVFLTPDSRPYKKSSGVFGGVTPARDFSVRGEERGPGAWELVARYSTLDLTDGWVYGGESGQWTLGLSWQLNPYTRWMFNYTRADIDRWPLYTGDIDIFQTRIQLNF